MTSSDASSRRFIYIALASTIAIGAGAIYTWWWRRDEAKEYLKSGISSCGSLLSTSNSDNEERISEAITSRTLGNKHFNAGRFKEAIECYTKSIEEYPRNHPDLSLAFSNRAAARLNIDELEEALEDCDMALKINPKFIKALDRKSRILEKMSLTSSALSSAIAASLIDDFKTQSLISHVEELVKDISSSEASEIIETRDRDGIEACYDGLDSIWNIRHFLHSFPLQWQQIKSLASLKAPKDSWPYFYGLLVEDSFQKANDLLEELMKDNSSEMVTSASGISEALEWKGTFLYLRGHFISAKECFKSAVERDDTRISVLIKLATTNLELGLYSEMTTGLEDALRVGGGEDPSIYFHRGELFALSDNMEAAIEDFKRTIKLSPTFLDAYVHQSRAMLKSGDSEGSKALLEGVLAEAKANGGDDTEEDSADILHAIAECLAMEGKVDEAIAIFERVVKLDPLYPHVHMNLAITRKMSRSGGFGDALAVDDQEFLKDLEEIVKEFPYFDIAHVQLANLYLVQRRFEDALKHYDIAIQYSKSQSDLISVITNRAVAKAQESVMKEYPYLTDKIMDTLLRD